MNVAITTAGIAIIVLAGAIYVFVTATPRVEPPTLSEAIRTGAAPRPALTEANTIAARLLRMHSTGFNTSSPLLSIGVGALTRNFRVNGS
jgi:hypothetical protein